MIAASKGAMEARQKVQGLESLLGENCHLLEIMADLETDLRFLPPGSPSLEPQIRDPAFKGPDPQTEIIRRPVLHLSPGTLLIRPCSDPLYTLKGLGRFFEVGDREAGEKGVPS